jgi:serine phosphatase RsbU (regulator of sigma subunit)
MQKVLRNVFIGGFILMAALAFVILMNFRQKRKANLILERQKREIELQKNKITDSISYARRIQHAMFPPEEFVHELLNDCFVMHKPRDIVSGDFFWIAEKDGKVVIAVADCTGHGVPGAFMSLLGITFLNDIVHADKLKCTSDILNSLRQKVIQSLHQTGKFDEARDGMELALCILDRSQGKLQFSGANRPMYLSRNGKIQVTKPDKMPIGIYDENLPFRCNELQLEPGDCIYMFSDGYTDQIGGPHKRTFKSKYLRELLAGIHHKPIAEQQGILEETLKDWKGSIEQTDDILVFGCRI